MAITLPYEIDEPSGGTVPYNFAHLNEDAYAGPEISMGWEVGNAATQTYWCNWSDLDAFIFAILGTNDAGEGTGSSGSWERHLPHRMPVDILEGNMFASRILKLVGLPGPNPDFDPNAEEDSINFRDYPRISPSGKIEYRYAAVTVQYEPSPWPMIADEQVEYDTPGGLSSEWMRFTTIRKVPRAEWFQIQAGVLFWVDDPVKTGDERTTVPHNCINLREETTDYVVTLHRVPDAVTFPTNPVGFVNQHEGFLRNHPQAPSTGFAAQTMLLTGVQEHIYPVAFTPVQYYSYDFLFTYKPNGWNKARRIRTDLTPPTFDYTSFTMDGKAPTQNNIVYKTADLRLLFLPGA